MTKISIRAAVSGDEEAIHSLLYELAVYERLTAKFRLTPRSLRAIYGDGVALLLCHCGIPTAPQLAFGDMVPDLFHLAPRTVFS